MTRSTHAADLSLVAPRPGDERWMARAIELARRGEGRTRPNPPVGAVLVRNVRCIAEGWHRRAGGPHAEEIALRRAGAAARGATLYVTLEPCCTHGRRPPCTDAILAAGVARVVVAVRDPNPRHRGRGLRRLAAAGVEVVAGVGKAEAAALIEPFACWIRRGRPFVTLKLAATLDGRIADAAGASRWITGAAARREVQRLRRRADAVMVGRGTAAHDDPSLRPRPEGGRRPWRIVVASGGDVPLSARMLNDEAVARTMIAVSDRCSAERESVLRNKGAEVLRLPEADEGGVDLAALLEALGRRDLLHVICEGGGALAASLFRAGLVDAVEYFLAPRLLGATARPAVGGGWSLAAMPELTWVDIRRLGRDAWLRLRPLRRRAQVRRGGRASEPRNSPVGNARFSNMGVERARKNGTEPVGKNPTGARRTAR